MLEHFIYWHLSGQIHTLFVYDYATVGYVRRALYESHPDLFVKELLKQPLHSPAYKKWLNSYIIGTQ
jgi:hypothetical protein